MVDRAAVTAGSVAPRMWTSAYVMAALPPLFWAGNFLIARIMRDEIPPIQMSFWRWLLALAILVPFAWSSLRRDGARIRKEWRFLAALGAIGVTAFNCFIYTALHHTTLVNAALVNSLLPIVTVVLAWSLLGERMSLRRALGILVSLLGVALVIARGDPLSLGSTVIARGDVLVFLGMSFWALYMVLLRKRPLGLGALSLLGVTTVFGVAFHIPFVLAEMSSMGTFTPTTRTVPALLYFAIFPSILAYVLWNRSVVKLGPAVTGMFMHLMPVFSAALAAAFLGETLAWYHPVAFALIVAGILFATPGRQRPLAKPTFSREQN